MIRFHALLHFAPWAVSAPAGVRRPPPSPEPRVFATKPKQKAKQMVELPSSPTQKLGTPCQSCGLHAKTNLRCSRWSAAAPNQSPALPAARPTPDLPSPSPCPGSKLVNYCSQECQLRGTPLPLPPSSCAEELSLNL